MPEHFPNLNLNERTGNLSAYSTFWYIISNFAQPVNQKGNANFALKETPSELNGLFLMSIVKTLC